MELEFYHYLIIIIGSATAGFINTLAGNGSAITLTILTEILQLPGNIANATNRVGIVFQSSASTYAFYTNGKLDVKKSWKPILFISIGAVAGIFLAIWVSNEQFKQVFKFMLVAMLFAILVKPKRWLQNTPEKKRISQEDILDEPLDTLNKSLNSTSNKKMPDWIAIPLFLALGFYGGFIQMGMGVMFLVIMVLVAKNNIIDANVLKSFVVALYTIVAIAIFHWQGLIDWKIGGLMAIGQTAGGWWTAQFASKYPAADVWAYRVLVVVVIGAILNMFGLFRWIAQLF
ncbi:MAG: sulfite exporter TauE/SafE family protein [Saprospiraceae bacterium]